MSSRFIPVFVAFLLPLTTLADNEIGFIEQFALAPDRAQVLNQLIPGSEEYYFFHALHFQNTRDQAKLAAIMGQWAKRFPDSAQRRVIENREALLSYDADPQATLAFLRERLDLRFDHQQEVRDQKPNLPTALDQALVSREAFVTAAKHNSDDLGRFDEAALESLLRDKVPLNPAQRRALLSRVKWPALPGLVEMIAAELKTPENRQFGEFPIHRALLPEQLNALLKLVPALAENEEFVLLRLRQLAPGADEDAVFDPVARDAWLIRLWDYARTLPAAFPTVKATILRQRLEFDRTRGVHNKVLFQEYLKLPRRFPYMNPKHLDAAATKGEVDLNRGFTEAALPLLPIGNDEALVRDYFLHFFAAEDSWEPYAGLVRDTWLKPIFAEAKIVNGAGDPEKWTSLLSPTAFQALRDRVDIDFSLANPPFHAPADEVQFHLFVKNAPKLIVKVYEINTLSFFLTQKRQLNTDLQLDGLVANAEQTHDLTTAQNNGGQQALTSPFRRVQRRFSFPELRGKRGAWVIEFIGGGKSSRALIRKGQWSLLQQTSAAGQIITVLDEARRPVADATVWLEGRKFVPDEKSGRIIVPFTQQPGGKPIILADAAGGFASLAEFDHRAENYRLDAQFHVSREQLLARQQATIAIRTAVMLGDTAIPLELLQQAKLAITSTTLDGIAATSEVNAPDLASAAVFTHTITVPDRLAKLSVTLSGKIENVAAGGEKQDVQASRDWEINSIDKTEATGAGHLSKFGEDWVFELLGKNGEPLADRHAAFEFWRQGINLPVRVALGTDRKGRINLGPLNGLEAVTLTDGANRRWWLDQSDRRWPSVIHAKAGDVIPIPHDEDVELASVSLLETRGGVYVANRISSLVVPEQKGAFYNIPALPPGDYTLRFTDQGVTSITLRITAGEQVQNWLVSPTRSLEVRDRAPLQIARVKLEEESVVVELLNADRFTRVHVAARRFVSPLNLYGDLGMFWGYLPATGQPARLPSLFAGGREIGDEYRYILDRRYASKYPGNMLSRPGLLLNPWEVRSTDLQALEAKGGEAAGATPGERPGSSQSPALASIPGMEVGPPQDGTNLDFLATAAPILYNLVPDEHGVIRIDRQLLGDRQHVEIYAEDLTTAVSRSIALPEAPTAFQDLRLARPLDPQKAFTEKNEVTVLKSGEKLTLADLTTSQMETYETLASVHALFTTLSSDGNLAKFAWLLQWPSLKDEEKRARYSEFASHELHFFLSRKDPAFFEAVIRPYLANKKDKTFMDEYLTGADLRRHLEPWAYGRLNVVERALLGQRIPGEAAAAARHLSELADLVPPDPARIDLLFQTALAGRGLQEGNLLDVAKNSADALMAMTAAPAAPDSAATIAGLEVASKPAAETLAKRMTGAKAKLSRRDLALGRMSEVDALADESRMKSALGVPLEESLALADLDSDFGLQEIKRERGLVRQFYRKLGATKEWAENNYYRLPIAQQAADLITINGFWRDFAAWDGKAPFLSKHVAEASRSFAEMLLALAVLDLPFDAAPHVLKPEGNEFTISAAGPLLVFHREINQAGPAEGAGIELLVSQNFYRHGDRHRQEGNEKVDKYVTDEFLTGVVYGANVVVTNPASSPQKLELLLQIPEGSIPVLGSKATTSRRVALEPYTTKTFEYFFYFPLPAEKAFVHFPVNVSRAEKSVGRAKPFTFKVVRQLSQVDKGSWDYVSQYGTGDEVWAMLEKENIRRLNLERIAWRVRKDAGFFRKLLALLEQRHLYSEPIYRYAALHNEPAALEKYLRHREDFVAQCGPWMQATILQLDPVERRTYEHLEYSPLVNQRAHRFGAEHRIANPVLREHYQELLRILALKPALDAADAMSVVYYQFLQDRVEEALARFAAIDAEKLPTRLQHDYFRCHAAFYEGKLDDARGVASKYAAYPVERWRKLFSEVTAQLDEIAGREVARAEGDEPDREKQQAELAATEPSFDFKVENREIALTWHNLGEVTINYYLMDPEFLFSSSPFVTEDAGRFSIIKPTETAVQKLPLGKNTLHVPVPAAFAKANVLIEVLGAGQRKAQAYHANTLQLNVVENYGRLEVRDEIAGKPVPKAYVKVYARLGNRTVRFFKDGYTDLRGKFDFGSLNSSDVPAPPLPEPRPVATGATPNYQMLRPAELEQVEKLAILIISEEHGVLVREAAPPRR